MWQAPCASHVSHGAAAMDTEGAGAGAGAGLHQTGLREAEVHEYCQKIVQGMKVGLSPSV